MSRCGNCGLLWLDPVPLEEDIHLAYRHYYTHRKTRERGIRAFYSTVADSYVRRRLGYPVSASFGTRFISRMLALIHPGGGAELARSALYLERRVDDPLLLDVGCGSGEFLSYMRNLGWRVEGVEVDSAAVETARSMGLSVREGELAAQNYPECYAEVISMVHVIEHLHDPMAALIECRRILKPGGRLIIATPNSASLGHRLFKSNWVSLDPPRHLILFDPKNLRRLLISAGFEIELLVTTARGARSAWTLGRHLRRAPTWDPSAPPSVINHLTAIPFQLTQRMLIFAGREAGEELFTVARPRQDKSSSSTTKSQTIA